MLKQTITFGVPVREPQIHKLIEEPDPTERKLLVASHKAAFDTGFDEFEAEGWELDGLPFFTIDDQCEPPREIWLQRIIRRA